MATPRDAQARFDRYVERLAEGVGHADRRRPLEGYVTGLLLGGERKSGSRWPPGLTRVT